MILKLMNKLVSLVILNYNNNDYTMDCLKSLKKQTYKSFEVILLDNGSKYDFYLELKKKITHLEKDLKIILIRTKLNLFFTGGNNKAIKIANGEYICLLNNDTIVSPNFIEKMVEFFEVNLDAGMISPKIKVYKNKNFLWYAGAEINFRKAHIANLRGTWERDPSDQRYDKITATAYAAGTALFLRKSLIEKIGLLDEVFFMYFEETDWNLRAKKYGYESYYVPTTIIYHKVTRNSNKKPSLLKHFFLNRNTQILIWKHATFINLLVFYLKFILNNLKVILIAFIQKKLYSVFLQLYSLWQGFRIGIKRRSNRSCRKNLIKDYYFIKRIEKKLEFF